MLSKEVTLLFDADEIKYKQSCINEQTFDWEDDGELSVVTDFKRACEGVDDFIAHQVEKHKATNVVVCLSCQEHNFRLDVYPDYKHNRKDKRKPELVHALAEYMTQNYKTYLRYGLEADDCMGILSTHPKLIEGKKIIISQDKDLRTIPGYLFNPNHSELGVQRISKTDADRFFMYQTVVGDFTDGYPGCKGVGSSSRYGTWVDDILVSDSIEEMWSEVLGAFGSRGFTEEDALIQARCARILRHTDYDYKNKKVILWEPPQIEM